MRKRGVRVSLCLISWNLGPVWPLPVLFAKCPQLFCMSSCQSMRHFFLTKKKSRECNFAFFEARGSKRNAAMRYRSSGITLSCTLEFLTNVATNEKLRWTTVLAESCSENLSETQWSAIVEVNALQCDTMQNLMRQNLHFLDFAHYKQALWICGHKMNTYASVSFLLALLQVSKIKSYL